MLRRKSIKKRALHNCGMKSLNSTLKTLPLPYGTLRECAFPTGRSANAPSLRSRSVSKTDAPRMRETKIIPSISNAALDSVSGYFCYLPPSKITVESAARPNSSGAYCRWAWDPGQKNVPGVTERTK
jgi:hypothetical protein